MAPVNSTHTRSHSLLLLQKLLNLRDGASPLTLLLDSLEQPSQPVVSEFITRAKVCMTEIPVLDFKKMLTGFQIAKSKVVFLSFATLKKPQDADVLVRAAGKDLRTVRAELLAHCPAFRPTPGNEKPTQSKSHILICSRRPR
jgi:elongator complex protein 5